MTVVKRWGPVAGWMAVIYTLSAQSPLPRVAPLELEELFSAAAHFTEYLLLALLLMRAASPVSRTGAVVTWVAACLYAATDEFHQSFVPGRDAAFGDWVVDACGSLVGVVYRLVMIRR